MKMNELKDVRFLAKFENRIVDGENYWFLDAENNAKRLENKMIEFFKEFILKMFKLIFALAMCLTAGAVIGFSAYEFLKMLGM